jgi:hypothetical protein
VNTTLFLLSFALFHPVGFFYRAAYFFIVGSYSLVLFNAHKVKKRRRRRRRQGHL